jgi:hypothetical protein
LGFLDTQLTWTAKVSQVGRKSGQSLGVLGPLPFQEKRLINLNRHAALQATHLFFGG